jgi:hypothetical protein
MLFHSFLDRVRGTDGNGSHNIVSFHMAGRAVDQRFARDATWSLRALGQSVHFGHHRDHGISGTPRRPDVGRHAGATQLNFKAGAFQCLL